LFPQLRSLHTFKPYYRVWSYETYMKKLGGHLGTTVNSYNTAYKELGKIDKDVLRITEKTRKTAMEPLELEKPAVELEEE